MKKLIVALMLVALLSAAALAEEVEGEHHGPALDGHYWMTQVIKLVNTGLVVGALIFFLAKPVRNFFRERANKIEEDLQAAQRAREEAERRLKEIQDEMAGLEAQIEEIKQSAREEGAAEKERIISQAKTEAERILANADREVDSRVKSGRVELKRYAAELAVGRAREIISERLDDSGDREFIQRTLTSIGGGR
jgi:F-type H+-transporting ATPase subunit b